MYPRYIKLVPSLPRTATEKVRKGELRQEAITSLATFFDSEKAVIR
jgi:acyl-coenzyme A synthetase/AMP-(fatty) acid ligase